MRVRGTVLAIALLLLPLAPLRAETLSVAGYHHRLAGIDGRLRAGDWTGARSEAGRLLQDRIRFRSETIEPDASVLGPLARASRAAEARAATPALARLIAALASAGGSRSHEPDAALLAAVRSRQKLAEIPRGGWAPHRLAMSERVAEFFEPAIDAIADAFQKLLDWLWKGSSDEERKSRGLPPRAITALVIAAALLIAAIGLWAWLRRRRGAQAAEARALPAATAADDDPLSREANEWERYARELAEAGRLREAIRAWYHAVLVALYRGGVLHYRKGRTNWEYVSTIPPGTPWRSRFADLTRRFELEWYGHDRSEPEALIESEQTARELLATLRGGRA